MKALVYTKPYRFEYGEFPDPDVKQDDVLIRVKACGICGSDVHGYTGETGRRIPPLIMGHEGSGIIEEVGANVRNLNRGDRVCFDSTVYCNRCEACKRGNYNRCENRQVLGVSTPSSRRDGAFAEFVAVPWWIVSRIPDDLPFHDATLVEPLSVGVHAANRAPTSEDKTAVVIGAGMIGNFIIQAIRLKGANKLIASDIKDFRLGIAKESGADVVVNARKEDLKRTVLEETNNHGADVVFEVVGKGDTFQQAVEITRMGGHVTVVGLQEKTVSLNVQDLVSKEITLDGSYASAGEYRECIGLLSSGKINVAPLITDVLPLSEGQLAFDRLHRGKEDQFKIILEP